MKIGKSIKFTFGQMRVFFGFVASPLKDKFTQGIFIYEPLRYFGKSFLFESLSRFHIGKSRVGII